MEDNVVPKKILSIKTRYNISNFNLTWALLYVNLNEQFGKRRSSIVVLFVFNETPYIFVYF